MKDIYKILELSRIKDKSQLDLLKCGLQKHVDGKRSVYIYRCSSIICSDVFLNRERNLKKKTDY